MSNESEQKPEVLEFDIVPQKAMPLAPPTEMDMLQHAIEKGASIETIERLVALREKMLDRTAEIEFNEALHRVQAKIKRVAPDLENTQTRSWYASYAAIDRVVRPLYSEEGFSLSFSEEDSNKPQHIRFVCFVSKGAHTRKYRKDMPADGKGAKGGDAMTLTHAAGAADSYARRYLLKDIFNIAIAKEEDTDGNMPMNDEEVSKNVAEIQSAKDLASLKFLYTVAYDKAREAGDKNAMLCYIDAKDKRVKELKNA